ncbi:MAG: hypothetical protein ACO1N0_12590 [Fluviicola sp.]
MKKLFIAALALTTTVFANAQAPAQTENNKAQAEQNIAAVDAADRVKIKLEELPEPVRNVLKDSAFQGWTAKTAYIVDSKKDSPYYEVDLANTTGELKTVKFKGDGTVIN